MNYTSEFLITIILTFHLICFFRNFYLTVHRESYIETESVDLYIKTKNISNNFYSNDYLEMCKKCDNLRFKRSHHCSICNRCVEMMDHHCIVLNSCIGRRNYKYFLSYLYLTVVNSFIVFSLSGISIYKYNMEYKEKVSRIFLH